MYNHQSGTFQNGNCTGQRFLPYPILGLANGRGLPKEMNSDNGTHFGGANRQLEELVVDKLDENKIRVTTADKEVQWHFNPPLTPPFGGAHGSKIKASKRAIYGIFGNTDVTDEELITAFTGAGTLINSQLLGHQSANPADDVTLTPNHFLHGQVGAQFAPESVVVIKS